MRRSRELPMEENRKRARPAQEGGSGSQGEREPCPGELDQHAQRYRQNWRGSWSTGAGQQEESDTTRSGGLSALLLR
jgi:hypothetical protein